MQLDEVIRVGKGNFRFGDLFPETSLILTLKNYSGKKKPEYDRQNNILCTLEISTDTGAVFGGTGPGTRSVNITLNGIDLEEGETFMRELIHEFDLAAQGKHPDPAGFPVGSSEWPLLWQLNSQAYNKISEKYKENYFENPNLTEAFTGWMARIPPGGHILDAGCGHGDPVIGRLLEEGFQVTGSDFSPEMLRRASLAYPQASFIQSTTTTIAEQAVFDGICSFNSLLYLDPIDLLNSIVHLHHALKPGGLIFLYAFDPGPDWKGEPFGIRIGQWMWSWHYGMEETAAILEEHGYFHVVETRKVQVDEKEAERIAEALEKQKRDEEKYLKMQEENPMPISIAI